MAMKALNFQSFFLLQLVLMGNSKLLIDIYWAFPISRKNYEEEMIICYQLRYIYPYLNLLGRLVWWTVILISTFSFN